jgi:hypothetical protein
MECNQDRGDIEEHARVLLLASQPAQTKIQPDGRSNGSIFQHQQTKTKYYKHK